MKQRILNILYAGAGAVIATLICMGMFMNIVKVKSVGELYNPAKVKMISDKRYEEIKNLVDKQYKKITTQNNKSQKEINEAIANLKDMEAGITNYRSATPDPSKPQLEYVPVKFTGFSSSERTFESVEGTIEDEIKLLFGFQNLTDKEITGVIFKFSLFDGFNKLLFERSYKANLKLQAKGATGRGNYYNIIDKDKGVVSLYYYKSDDKYKYEMLYSSAKNETLRADVVVYKVVFSDGTYWEKEAIEE